MIFLSFLSGVHSSAAPLDQCVKSFIDLDLCFGRGFPSGTVEPNPRSTGEGCFFVKCASMTYVGLFGSGDQCGCRPAFQSQL